MSNNTVWWWCRLDSHIVSKSHMYDMVNQLVSVIPMIGHNRLQQGVKKTIGVSNRMDQYGKYLLKI